MNSNQNPITIMKFGGTSVGDAEAIRRLIGIVQVEKSSDRDIVLVVSAMSGVTSMLIAGAEGAVGGDLEPAREAAAEMRDRHYKAASELLPDPGFAMQLQTEIEPLLSAFLARCQAVRLLGEITPRVMDSIASLGERMSVRLIAAAFKGKGLNAKVVEASDCIVTDSVHQAAHPDFSATAIKTRQTLAPLLEAGKLPVVTGFLAADASGTLTTLGRGGSDYSAAIFGVAMSAEEVLIWTDVDGVMTGDPRIVQRPRSIPRLTFHEVGELAYFGARVLHPKTIRPVIEAGIRLAVKNSFNPGHPGTLIVENGHAGKGPALKAVTVVRNQKMIAVEGRGMLGVPGVAGRTFQAVAGTATSVTLITQASSEQSISFAVPSHSAVIVVEALKNAFKEEILDRDIDRVTAGPDAAVVTLVGAGMRETPGIAGAIFSVLGAEQINVFAIAQGSSDASICLVVDAGEADRTVQVLHELIIELNSSNKEQI